MSKSMEKPCSSCGFDLGRRSEFSSLDSDIFTRMSFLENWGVQSDKVWNFVMMRRMKRVEKTKQ